MNATASGRPVRFFALLMSGWVIIRIASIASDMLGTPGPTPLAKPLLPKLLPSPAQAATQPILFEVVTLARLVARHPQPLATLHRSQPEKPQFSAVAAAPVELTESPPSEPITPLPATIAPAPPPLPVSQQTDRFRASTWLLWRDGGAAPAGIFTGGRLGGSQAGIRIDYDLTPTAPGRTAPYARVTTAMNRPASPEAAAGIAWQPARAIPISIAAERRIALGKGARNANAVLAAGGFGPTKFTGNIEAEAYAQAGMVGFRRTDLFADGKVSLMTPLGQSPARLGASLSGGAQPLVERLDIGPELQVRLLLPRVATRLSVEWRERVAGRANPGSGLTVTLGADF